jgi:hypothetical protein
LFNGVYVDADVPVTHRLLCLVAQAHVLPSGSVIAGRSAAHLYGVPADPGDPVEAIVPAGAWHGAPGQLHADRRRINRLVAAGWTVLHVTSVRLRDELDGVVAEIRAAIGRCL